MTLVEKDLNVNTAEPLEPFLQGVLQRHPAYVAAGLGVFGYVVAGVYLQGYMSFFAASAHWFDPGIFRLITFCWPPLLIAAAVAVLYYNLNVRTEVSRLAWGSMYAIWIASTLVFLYACGLSIIEFGAFTSKGTLVWGASMAFVWLLGPLIHRWQTGRLVQRKHQLLAELRSGIGRLQVPHSSAELESERVELLAEMRRLHVQVTEIGQHAKTSRLELFTRGVSVLFFLYIAGGLGFIRAGYQYEASMRMQASARAGDSGAAILFTDGTLSLVRQPSGGDVVTLLYGDKSCYPTQLTIPSERQNALSKRLDAILKSIGDEAMPGADAEPPGKTRAN
ncbi:MAG: hypothetical protein U0572_07670 [Phycisphaerales bacterium]